MSMTEPLHTAAKTRNESVLAAGHVTVKYTADLLPVQTRGQI